MALASFIGGAIGGSTVSIIIRAQNQFSQEFKRAEGDMESLKKKSDEMGYSLAGIDARAVALGRTLTAGVLAVGLAGAASLMISGVKSAAAYRDQMAGVDVESTKAALALAKLQGEFSDANVELRSNIISSGTFNEKLVLLQSDFEDTGRSIGDFLLVPLEKVLDVMLKIQQNRLSPEDFKVSQGTVSQPVLGAPEGFGSIKDLVESGAVTLRPESVKDIIEDIRQKKAEIRQIDEEMASIEQSSVGNQEYVLTLVERRRQITDEENGALAAQLVLEEKLTREQEERTKEAEKELKLRERLGGAYYAYRSAATGGIVLQKEIDAKRALYRGETLGVTSSFVTGGLNVGAPRQLGGFVSETGMALVHAGEFVLPPKHIASSASQSIGAGMVSVSTPIVIRSQIVLDGKLVGQAVEQRTIQELIRRGRS